MLFGFHSKYQEKIDFVSGGRTFSTGSFRAVTACLIAWRTAPCVFEYIQSQPGSVPAEQNLLSSTVIPYNASDNRYMPPTVSGGRGFRWATVATLVPTPRSFRLLIQSPHFVKAIDWQPASIGTGAGTGGVIEGVVRIPYLVYLDNIIIRHGLVTNGSTGITGLTGAFPPNLRHFQDIRDGTPEFTSIQHPFNERLHTMIMYNSSTVMGADMNRVLSAAKGLVNCYLAENSVDDSAGNGSYRCPVPSLDCSHMSAIETLVMETGTLTTLTFPVGHTGWKKIRIRGCTGISNASFELLIDTFKTQTAIEYFIINACSKTVTRSFTDSDFHAGLIYFSIADNAITGTLTLTTSRPTLTTFKLGSSASIVTPSTKQDFATVNVSGVTNATEIDLTNSRIVNLTLPVNTVCTTLKLGGNKLDVTVNPSLVSQITAMTALQFLLLSTGVSTQLTQTIHNGQDSVNGFGVNLNLSALPALISLQANMCVLSGTLTLPSAMQGIHIINNNLTAISGPGTSLATLRAANNPLFTTNFTLIPNVTNLWLNATAQVTLDVSGKTTTTDYVLFEVTNNPSLTSISLPSVLGRANISDNIGVLIITGNTSLTTLNNLDKLTYTTPSAQGRPLNLSGNALDIDFKIGVTAVAITINISSNGISVANCDINIGSLYTNRRKWDTLSATKTLTMSGTNGVPTGTFAAPADHIGMIITGITQANPAVVTVSSIGALVNNQVIRIRNVTGMGQVNNQYYMVKNISGNTFQLYNEAGTTPINSSGFTAYVSGGSAYVEGTPTSAKEQAWVLVNVFAWTITMN